MARVDSLPDAAKEVLQAGSVIEREFSYELIKAVTELPEQELSVSSLFLTSRASLRTRDLPSINVHFQACTHP